MSLSDSEEVGYVIYTLHSKTYHKEIVAFYLMISRGKKELHAYGKMCL